MRHLLHMVLEAPVLQNQLRTASFAPSPALRPYIRRFVIVEYSAGHSTKLLPNAGFVAAFRFKGACLVNGSSAPNALVTGVWDEARLLVHSGNCANVIAMFTPTGAAAFLREPVANLFNSTMAFEQHVRRSQLDLIEEQLAESNNDLPRIQAVEQFLLAQLRYSDPDRLVVAALSDIHRTFGVVRIGTLASRLGLSQSTLERRFRHAVGTTPKKFSTIVRLRHVVRLHQAGASLTEISYSAGYTDQAHFIKDFRRFAGEAPTPFFRQTSGFC